MATYQEAWKRATAILDEGDEAFIVISRMGGYYAASCREEVGDGEILQYARNRWKEFNLLEADVVGSA